MPVTQPLHSKGNVKKFTNNDVSSQSSSPVISSYYAVSTASQSVINLSFFVDQDNLDAFHLIYVGYRADEWMNTMTRIYRDIAGVRFEPKLPEGDAGKYIYTDWETNKRNLK